MIDPYELEDSVDEALTDLYQAAKDAEPSQWTPPLPVVHKGDSGETGVRQPTIEVDYIESELETHQHSGTPAPPSANTATHRLFVDFITERKATRREMSAFVRVGYKLPEMMNLAWCNEPKETRRRFYWEKVERVEYDGTATASPRAMRYVLIIEETLP